MANKRSISTMRPTPSEKQRGPQSLPLRMENFGGAGKPESSKHFSAEIAAFASLWSVILGKRGLVFNSLTFSCYLASILCKNAEMPHFRAAFLLCIFFINTFWRSGRDSNPRTAFGRHTISSRARYDHFDTTAYLNAQQQASLYQNWARSQYPIFPFPQKRDGAALRLFPFCPYFSCSSAASFRQQQKTSIACCSSSTGGRDGATRILLSFGSTP